jgi:hypothetical protein
MIAGAKLASIFQSEAQMQINRNFLYLLIGALGIGAGAFAYWLYQEQHKSGVEINIGPRGVTIEEK